MFRCQQQANTFRDRETLLSGCLNDDRYRRIDVSEISAHDSRPVPPHWHHNQRLRGVREASKPRRRDPRDSRRQECDVCSLESQAEENSSAPGRLTPSVRVPCKQQRPRWSRSSQSSCCLSAHIFQGMMCHWELDRKRPCVAQIITPDSVLEALQRSLLFGFLKRNETKFSGTIASRQLSEVTAGTEL